MRREEEEKWRMEVELLVEEEGEAGENVFVQYSQRINKNTGTLH